MRTPSSPMRTPSRPAPGSLMRRCCHPGRHACPEPSSKHAALILLDLPQAPPWARAIATAHVCAALNREHAALPCLSRPGPFHGLAPERRHARARGAAPTGRATAHVHRALDAFLPHRQRICPGRPLERRHRRVR
eukprot:359802-Chlamydomonas_euryale.AAC.1